MTDEIVERCLMVKPEVFVYNIPPRNTARGYRAADWNLSLPNWTGRLRCVALGKKLDIRLEDKTSGELFAACPVEQYPGTSVEAVTDSSRYFVVCVQDSGRKAYIGIGFADRADSFDLNVTLQDHFKYLKKESEAVKTLADPGPKLDLAFKAGQTIRINIPSKKQGDKDQGDGGEDEEPQAAKARVVIGGGLGLGLPPPPGGNRIPGPPGTLNLTPMQSPSEPRAPVIPKSNSSNLDLLGDLMGGVGISSAQAPPNPPVNDLLGGVGVSAPPAATIPQQPAAPPAGSSRPSDDLWGDFESATKASGSWTTF